MVCLGQIDGRDTTLGRETCLFDNLKSLVLQILSYGFSLKFALCFKNIAGLGIPLYRRLQIFFEILLVDLLVSSRPLAGLIFCCPLGVPHMPDKRSTCIVQFIAMTDHSSMTEGQSVSRLRLIERQGRWFVVDKYMVGREQIVYD